MFVFCILKKGREGCGLQRKTRKQEKKCFVVFLVRIGNRGFLFFGGFFFGNKAI